MADTGARSGSDLSVESSLIERCRHGDPRAKRELLTRVLPTMRVATGEFLGPGADADDATLQAAVEVLRELPTYRGETTVEAWARAFAAAAGRRRTHKPQRPPGEDTAAEVSSPGLTPLERDIIEQALDADAHAQRPEPKGERRPGDPGDKAPVHPVWVVVFLIAAAAALGWLARATAGP